LDFVVVSHAAAEVYWPGERIVEGMRRGFGKARVCYFVSRGNLELTIRQLASPLPHARIVRNPFNVSYDAAPGWPEEDGVLRLACVGRLDAVCKGQDLIFEVLRQERWRRRPVRVTLLGKGPQEGAYRDLVRMYGLDCVKFAGFTGDLEGVWARHHALLLPSRLEGLPLAIVEAMLCGRPCVVTDVAGNAEIVEDGVSGFVAAAPTVGLLDEAMERAWEAREKLREMGRAAGERVRSVVPRDPVGVFAEELLALAGGGEEPEAPADLMGMRVG
jgi:glycosyltransferase involved in cell wall biosynthesis